MQAMGLVNDHLEGCYVRREVERARRRARPAGAAPRAHICASVKPAAPSSVTSPSAPSRWAPPTTTRQGVGSAAHSAICGTQLRLRSTSSRW